jgi:hypothetical protein
MGGEQQEQQKQWSFESLVKQAAPTLMEVRGGRHGLDGKLEGVAVARLRGRSIEQRLMNKMNEPPYKHLSATKQRRERIDTMILCTSLHSIQSLHMASFLLDVAHDAAGMRRMRLS